MVMIIISCMPAHCIFLSTYSIENSNKMERTLLNHSREVVSAMVYLSTRGYIHRDLAARNILVSKEGICKVSNDSKLKVCLLPKCKALLKGALTSPKLSMLHAETRCQ